MTIADAFIEKKRLEQQILSLLMDLEKNTGLTVSGDVSIAIDDEVGLLGVSIPMALVSRD